MNSYVSLLYTLFFPCNSDPSVPMGYGHWPRSQNRPQGRDERPQDSSAQAVGLAAPTDVPPYYRTQDQTVVFRRIIMIMILIMIVVLAMIIIMNMIKSMIMIRIMMNHEPGDDHDKDIDRDKKRKKKTLLP